MPCISTSLLNCSIYQREERELKGSLLSSIDGIRKPLDATEPCDIDAFARGLGKRVLNKDHCGTLILLVTASPRHIPKESIHSNLRLLIATSILTENLATSRSIKIPDNFRTRLQQLQNLRHDAGRALVGELSALWKDCDTRREAHYPFTDLSSHLCALLCVCLCSMNACQHAVDLPSRSLPSPSPDPFSLKASSKHFMPSLILMITYIAGQIPGLLDDTGACLESFTTFEDFCKDEVDWRSPAMVEIAKTLDMELPSAFDQTHQGESREQPASLLPTPPVSPQGSTSSPATDTVEGSQDMNLQTQPITAICLVATMPPPMSAYGVNSPTYAPAICVRNPIRLLPTPTDTNTYKPVKI
ncbi:hypothetical protein BDY21DRAFT_53864 [Lineolata rhizophorae]|uniref:Uncharacterized protein n=1 Tax=Lineolata rhizophorae TaxID=578093 RepID=A0A6A6NXY3_9PEZI|nr:hypothetical protein BDY21DRAFT_53864 [Lineolata rhizophorae]